jgi:hypothetical protein
LLLKRNKDEPWKCERCHASGRTDYSPQLTGNSHLLDDPMNIEQDFWAELAQIQAESIGWIPLDEGAYLHVGSDDAVIQVVGIAKVEMAGGNVLWLL